MIEIGGSTAQQKIAPDFNDANKNAAIPTGITNSNGQSADVATEVNAARFEEYLNHKTIETVRSERGGQSAAKFDPADDIESNSIYQQPGQMSPL